MTIKFLAAAAIAAVSASAHAQIMGPDDGLRGLSAAPVVATEGPDDGLRGYDAMVLMFDCALDADGPACGLRPIRFSTLTMPSASELRLALLDDKGPIDVFAEFHGPVKNMARVGQSNDDEGVEPASWMAMAAALALGEISTASIPVLSASEMALREFGDEFGDLESPSAVEWIPQAGE